MQQADGRAAQLTKEILAEAGQACDALKKDARERLPQAAALIVEKVVNG